MIILSKETKDLIYTTLNALEKVPKVKDVDAGLKELIKQELSYTKVRHNYGQRNCKYYKINTNVTDKLVDSYIGVILKRIRVGRVKTAFLSKRVPSVKNMPIVLAYYKMDNWETIRCPSSKCISASSILRSTLDRMKIEFTNKVLTFKDITLEEAYELVVENHTKQLKSDLLKYVNLYFK